MIVASAAPLIPMPKRNMNTGSRMILVTAPTTTVVMPITEKPWAVMKGFIPVATIEKIVPRRYIRRYGSAYTMFDSDVPKTLNIGCPNSSPTAISTAPVTTKRKNDVF